MIIKDGTLEVNIDGKVKVANTGSMIFYAANELENMKNVGNAPATYYVIQFFTALTPKQPDGQGRSSREACAGDLGGREVDCDQQVPGRAEIPVGQDLRIPVGRLEPYLRVPEIAVAAGAENPRPFLGKNLLDARLNSPPSFRQECHFVVVGLVVAQPMMQRQVRRMRFTVVVGRYPIPDGVCQRIGVQGLKRPKQRTPWDVTLGE